MTIGIRQNSSLTIEVTVKDPVTKVVKNLTGGSVTAVAKSKRSADTVAFSAAITDAVNGVVQLTIAKDLLEVDEYTIFCRANLGAESQIAYEEDLEICPAPI